MSTQRKKKQKKADKKKAMKIILSIGEQNEDQEDRDEDKDERRMYFEKEEVQLLYNALKNYTPAGDERALYETWLEMFEETLVVDFKVKLPGFAFMDEEDN